MFFLKYCSLKKYIFKTAYLNNIFPNLLPSKITPSKNTLSKLLPQKIHFQNCSVKEIYIFRFALENYILKTALSKNTFSKIKFSKFFSIKTLLESTESSKELYKSSMICLITFFSIYLQLKILVDNSFHLY